MIVGLSTKPLLRSVSLIRPSVVRTNITHVRYKSHEGSYKSKDTTVETDEIVSDNNPWSPTLYTDPVKVRKPGHIRPFELKENYRLSYQPIYEAPGSKYVSLLKRLTISFGVLGCYGAKLFYDSPHFEDIYAYSAAFASFTPAVIIQHKTKDYVTRIFRLYDKSKPQTLQNLINDENLIVEKLNFTGSKTYNQLIRVTDNNTLKLAPEKKFPLLGAYSSWVDIEPDSKLPRKHFIVDDIGGIKMDRLWGIVERNSGVDNGRYIDYNSVEKTNY